VKPEPTVTRFQETFATMATQYRRTVGKLRVGRPWRSMPFVPTEPRQPRVNEREVREQMEAALERRFGK